MPRKGCIPNHTIKKGLRDLRDQQPLGIGQKPPKNQICFASGNRNIYIYIYMYDTVSILDLSFEILLDEHATEVTWPVADKVVE